MKKLLFISITLAFILSVSAEANEKIIKFGVFFTSTGGQSSSQSLDFTNTLADAVAAEFGYKIEPKKYSSDADVKQAFLDNEIDAALLWSGHIVEIDKRGGRTFPWVTIEVDKKRTVSQCLWGNNSRSGNADILSIGGSNLLAHDNDVLLMVMLREYLFTQGIDIPLWREFKTFTQMKNMNSAFMALAMGSNDYYWVSSDDTFLKMLNPNLLNQVKPVFCTKPVYARSAVIFNRKTMSDASIKELREAFKKYYTNRKPVEDKYPNVKALYQYLKMAKIKMVLAKEDEFKVENALYEKAIKNGWLEEAKFIQKKWSAAPVGQPVEIKMDFKSCKAVCAPKASAGEREVCIDACMK